MLRTVTSLVLIPYIAASGHAYSNVFFNVLVCLLFLQQVEEQEKKSSSEEGVSQARVSIVFMFVHVCMFRPLQ